MEFYKSWKEYCLSEKLEFKSWSQEELRRGHFGNCMSVWASLKEIDIAGYTGNVTVRSSGENKAKTFVEYDVSLVRAKEVVDEFQAQGIRARDIFFNEIVPDDKLVLQGEVGYVNGNFVLRYSIEKNTKMRDAMDDAEHIFGLTARLLLKQVMTGNSYDDLLDLFEMYPNHIVEFGVYDCHLGWAKGRNSVIWDVRDY
jgi:hypothetical protein